MKVYRREIDGLRAIALLPVILFHAGFESFGGGFVGVDVFFVISGYLITSVIVAEQATGQFTLARFYERRARRILPALFLMMAVCVPTAWLSLPSRDWKDFAVSGAAVSAFISNVLFWRSAGYFETAAELKPLLHTWSLSVEEQFYLLFPLLFLVRSRAGRRPMILMLSAGTLASLLCGEWGSLQKPNAAFFLLPFRGWELGIGALASLLGPERPSPRPMVGQCASMLGLGAILWSVFAFDRSTPFPGIYALVPTIGAVLVILFARPSNVVGTLLGSWPAVGIGLVSYSAYLWHQPLFAFARHLSLGAPSEGVFACLSVLSLALAYVSWRFIEQPFRRPGMVGRAQVIWLALGGISFFLALGATNGFGGVFPPRGGATAEADKVERRMKINKGLAPECDHYFTLSPACRTHPEPEVVLWGDSLAMHLVQAFRASEPQVRMVQLTMSACGPLLGIAPYTRERSQAWLLKCIETNDRVVAYIKESKSVKRVVIASALEHYLDPGRKVLLRDGTVAEGALEAYQALQKTIASLHAAKVAVTIVSPTPQTGMHVGRCVLRATMLGLNRQRCDMRFRDVESHQTPLRNFLQRFSASADVLWLHEGLCDQQVCRATADGNVLYRDSAHLTPEGSAWLGRRMDIYRRVLALDSARFR